MRKTKKELAVLVTTTHKGVFFGYTNDPDGDIISLRSARLCIYWSEDLRGFMGLALRGPSSTCRIGARANIRLRNITSVSEVTADAAQAWEAAP